ncbi:DNA recombination/repair protein RecA, partial [Clostridioides difficile]|nr:DNA recombination/repair protein RecA [Clostridioides difficile]
MSVDQEKLKALNEALGKIEKDFGKGSVMKLGEATSMSIDVISTGAI